MGPRIHIVTLGVSDLARSRRFYEEWLGWKASSASNEHFVIFKSEGSLLALFPEKALAQDANVDPIRKGFRGISLAHNVAEKHEVETVLRKAEAAGAKIEKVAQDVFWGGHSGYFSDPDGHLWEVAWNPLWPIQKDGSIQLPI
jgi:catechol 2,3-dioxygenase-like lactoylglutathione lyase family enzyme